MSNINFLTIAMQQELTVSKSQSRLVNVLAYQRRKDRCHDHFRPFHLQSQLCTPGFHKYYSNYSTTCLLSCQTKPFKLKNSSVQIYGKH